MSNYSKQTNWGQFIPLVTVFFFWGFVAASNDILIPVFQKLLNYHKPKVCWCKYASMLHTP